MTSFNAGEVSPLLEARVDYEKYDNSCKTLQNMLVLTQGPVTRRPGTEYIASVKTSTDTVRLIPFEYSKSDTYILEFGDAYMRVYRNGGRVLSGANAYELATDYDGNDVFEIQYAQSENIMYLVHSDYPPAKLTRADHNDWSIADANIITGPFQDENTTATEITPTGTTGSITLTADANLWNADHVGMLWQLTHRTEEGSLNGVIDTNESSDTLSVSGGYDFTTHGTWTGTVRLERSFDSGTSWEAVTTRHSEDDTNIEFSDTETSSGVIYRVTGEDFDSGACTYNLSAYDSSQSGVVQLTSYTDPNEVVGTVVVALADTNATSRWNEGYWSDANGWPQTVEFHEERIIYGGSTTFPQTIWASESGSQYEEMTAGLDDDDAFIFVLPGQNPIQWLLSQDYILIGTLGGAGRLGRTDEALTPTTPEYRTQAKQGSAYIQPAMVGDSVLYVERGGTKVREFVYNFERDRFVAPDLTILAEHITDSGIVDIAYQARPESILWCVRDDGVLLSLTYEQRDQGVVGWARHVTDGYFESVAVIPSTDEDEVWFVVQRTIDGTDVRYVEQLQPRNWDTATEAWYVDSGLAFDGGDAVNISNITQASPCVVTVATWPANGAGTNLADGDQIIISGVSGMSDVNDNIYTIDDANVTALTFSLDDSTGAVDINSVAFSAYTSGGTVQRVEKNFTNLSHLEGETVLIWADGMTQPSETVSSGAIEIDEWANYVVAGVTYTSALETQPIFFGTQAGLNVPDKKIVGTAYIDFYETIGAQFGVEGDVDSITFTPNTLYSGFKSTSFPHGIWRKASMYVQETLALPMTVRGIYIRFTWTK
jgi:hypothetical protein